MTKLTHTRLLEILRYDPDTGEFWPLVGRRGCKADRPVGRRSGSFRYIQIHIDRESFLAHRLAWFYVKGEWPANQVDHIDGNKLNNRFANLREATHQQNSFNRPAVSGLKGVSRLPSGRWQAQITVDQKTVYLGSFDTESEAHSAYHAEAKIRFGKFAPELTTKRS